MSRSFLWIDGPAGRIPAVLQRPAEGQSPRACVVMFNAGQMGRAGPQRLSVNAAEAWAAQGIATVRVDLAGVGDHPGDNPERHFDGHRIDEAEAVVKHVASLGLAPALYVQGLCAGARVALRVAARRKDVHGVVAWGCPIVSSAPNSLKSPYENTQTKADAKSGIALHEARDAIRSGRIFQPSWYLRRFRGGGREFGDLARGLLRRLRRKPATAGNPFLADTDALLRARRPVLFVYGQRDNLPLREFRERHATIPADLAAPQAVQVIDHATHTFNSLDSQAAVIACTAEWLLGRR